MGMRRLEEEANGDLRAFWKECKSFEEDGGRKKEERVSSFFGEKSR
jgi:hypothetical protein